MTLTLKLASMIEVGLAIAIPYESPTNLQGVNFLLSMMRGVISIGQFLLVQKGRVEFERMS